MVYLLKVVTANISYVWIYVDSLNLVEVLSIQETLPTSATYQFSKHNFSFKHSLPRCFLHISSIVFKKLAPVKIQVFNPRNMGLPIILEDLYGKLKLFTFNGMKIRGCSKITLHTL